jgi:rRNA maturation RNase YbeY
MIAFNYETDFKLAQEPVIRNWLKECISDYDRKAGELNFIFCDDAYLHKLNVEFLKHDTYTDIITFDYSLGKTIAGDIFISVERVKENAKKFGQTLENEMNRVIIHGILHLCGLGDKTADEIAAMRAAETDCLNKLTK